jgi:hypothetical protein
MVTGIRPRPTRLKLERLGAALLVGLLLFIVSEFMDWLLYWMKISNVETIVNNVVIAVCGAVAAYIWVRYEAERQARARDKMILVIELNHHIRNALTLLSQSATLQDGPEKLRMIDEAMERVKRVLTELVPTVGEADAPRLYLEDRTPDAPPIDPKA